MTARESFIAWTGGKECIPEEEFLFLEQHWSEDDCTVKVWWTSLSFHEKALLTRVPEWLHHPENWTPFLT